jgi:hypothetical protein
MAWGPLNGWMMRDQTDGLCNENAWDYYLTIAGVKVMVYIYM